LLPEAAMRKHTEVRRRRTVRITSEPQAGKAYLSLVARRSRLVGWGLVDILIPSDSLLTFLRTFQKETPPMLEQTCAIGMKI